VAGLRRLLDDPAAAAAQGASGRRFVESWASPSAVAAAYSELFAALTGTVASRSRQPVG
jgi:hypothetical protein